MLLTAQDWQEAQPCLQSALDNAADAAHLSFCLYLRQ